MSVPRPPRRVLRRIDRLSRAAHRFHRFAHHPLCDEYAGEVLRVGRTRVCRGCTLAACGGLAGGAVGLLAAPPLWVATAAAVLGVALLPLSHGGKWRSRFAPSLLFALATGAGIAAWSLAGLAVSAGTVAIFVLLLRAYRRRGPDRAPCATCPERTAMPCRGFMPIVRRERAFQRRVRALWVA